MAKPHYVVYMAMDAGALERLLNLSYDDGYRIEATVEGTSSITGVNRGLVIMGLRPEEMGEYLL